MQAAPASRILPQLVHELVHAIATGPPAPVLKKVGWSTFPRNGAATSVAVAVAEVW